VIVADLAIRNSTYRQGLGEAAKIFGWMSNQVHTVSNIVVSIILMVVAVSVPVHPTFAQERKLIAIIVPSHEIPFFRALSDAAASKANQLGYASLPMFYDCGAVQQNETVRAAIEHKPAAIVCYLTDPAASIDVLKKAKEATVPCIVIGREINPPGLAAAEIVPNYYQGAIFGAHKFVTLMGEEGDYVELVGEEPSAWIISEGYSSVISQYPRLKRIPSLSHVPDQEAASQIVRDVILQHPQIKGVIFGNYRMALAAQAALQTAHKANIIIVAFNGVPDCYQSLGQPGINASVVPSGRQMAQAAVEQADKYIKTGKTDRPQEQWIDFTLLTAEGQESPARSGYSDTIFGALRTAAERLSSKSELFAKIDVTAPKLIDHLDNNIKTLQALDRAMPMPQPYLLTLEADATLLAKASFDEVSAKVWAIITYVIGDTDSKIENQNKNPTNPYSVEAIVETKKDGERIAHLIVCYVQKGYEEDWRKLKNRFPDESTPTSHKMASGKWLMWAETPEGKETRG
jgi:erythritol transport system substrate-binding protein